ncbi:MAG: flavodoxin family protein [Cyanobacteria bacterium SIG29]|nr:flavodoxin family protein [Cyanobacteria bacterium SIG29]
MKVVAINGSPRKGGNTETMLKKVLEVVEKHGIETQLIQVGGTNIHGCRACWACKTLKNRKCVCNDDILNDILEDVFNADAIILGTPSYFSDMTPELKAFIDRAGVIALGNDKLFKHKIGAGVIAQRRGGATSIQASLHHMFLMSEMLITGSTYWNLGFGKAKDEVLNDEEAMQNMENLAENICWLLKKIKKN